MKRMKLRWAAVIFGFTLLPMSSHALDIYSVYLGNCKREIGTIIEVRDQNFDLLTTGGKIKTFPRYQAVYLATYPIDFLPISKLSINKGIEVYHIESLSGNTIKPLLKGWAINFTQDQVSFLTINRDEVLVDKSNIWNIKKEKKHIKFKSSGKKLKEISFLDPYPFASCKRKKENNVIFPQKLYSNATDVRTEFNRLQFGHEELAKFIRRKAFYPRPEIYKNKSILGIWLMPESRYGGSGSRSNNFSPFLRNELSLGAYSYQHLITTGSGPILDGTHAETQMHFYYRMKAEYIHFSFMTDPNIFLVGHGQYAWSKEDLDDLDFRINENTFLEFGLDYGAWSLEVSPSIDTYMGVRFGEAFSDRQIPVKRFGLRYTGLNYMVNFIYGQSFKFDEEDLEGGRHENENDFSFVRLNFQKKIRSQHELILSVINKNASGQFVSHDYTAYLPYSFGSWSFSGLYRYEYRRRFYFSTILGLEIYNMEVKGAGEREGEVLRSVNPSHMIFGINAAIKF